LKEVDFEQETPQKLSNLLLNSLKDAQTEMSPMEFPNTTTSEATTNATQFEVAESANDTRSRIFPLGIEASNNGRIKMPTIRLSQIVRKLVFPDWIWKGSGLTRKVGLPSNNVEANGTKSSNSVPIPLLKLPTITFDNNYSRCK